MENKKKPIISQLRSTKDDFASPLIDPDAAELSGNAFLTNPVASAWDCTGITQTVPEDTGEARSITNLAYIPVTSLEENEEEKDMPPRDWVDSAD